MSDNVTASELALKRLAIPFCPWTPTPKQARFLLDFCSEAFFGGSVGSSKSVSILMGACQFLHVPGYDALVLRKTFADLSRPGALMDLAERWWGPYLRSGRVQFDRARHTYRFACPDGGWSRVEFGALDDVNARLKYQGGQWQYLAFDELTQFKESDYTYLFSRRRRVSTGPLAEVPVRTRSTGNPGGPGASWVYRRFVAPAEAFWRREGPEPERHFHPAWLADNPYLDRIEYEQSLQELDPVTRAQLLEGDWSITPKGRMFNREWFIPIAREKIPANCRWIRAWDMAATEPTPGNDPDYTVGVLMGRSPDGRFFIADVRRWREGPAMNDLRCQATVLHDTHLVQQVVEQDPGAAGKALIRHLRAGPFASASLRAIPSSGKSRGRVSTISAGRRTSMSKILAAGPLSSHADAGEVFIVVDGSWDHEAFLREVEGFPDLDHDDQVDSAALALIQLVKNPVFAPIFDNQDLRQDNYWAPAPMSLSMEPGARVQGQRTDRIRTKRELDELQARMYAIYHV